MGSEPVQDEKVIQEKQQEQQHWQGHDSSGVINYSNGLDHTLTLLAAKDDTSRFVGLALLKTILEKKTELQEDPEIIQKCWETIPSRFLDRLLKAAANHDKPKDETQYMSELAIAVLHAFVVLLPDYVKHSKKAVDRIPALLEATTQSPPDSTTQILQVLLTLASTEDGAIKLLQSSSWIHVVGIASLQNLGLEIIRYAFIVASSNPLGRQTVQKVFDATISTILISFEDAPVPSGFFETLLDIIVTISDDAIPSDAAWFTALADLIIKDSLSRHNAGSADNRHGLILLTAAMLRLLPRQFSILIFARPTSSPESKSHSFLFTKLILVDIKSSIPSLQEILNSSHYPKTSVRIACNYNILSAFIGHLVHILDEQESLSSGSISAFIFSPSLLLQLRADISETISLTFEHLRDRFDASVAGALGLHPSARARTEASPTAPLAIAWDSFENPIAQDPLTLAQIQTVALWLHENDNDSLRREAAGIMDVFLQLYSFETDSDVALHFQRPVLMALESIILVPEGINSFLAADGWTVLSKDLQIIVRVEPPFPDDLTHHRGVDIIRVLLDIAQSDITGPVQEDWMNIVDLAAHPFSPLSCSSSSYSTDLAHDKEAREREREVEWTRELDLRIAIAQLAVELLVRAPKGARRRNLASARELLESMRALGRSSGQGKGNAGRKPREGLQMGSEAREGLEEVLLGLEEFGIS